MASSAKQKGHNQQAAIRCLEIVEGSVTKLIPDGCQSQGSKSAKRKRMQTASVLCVMAVPVNTKDRRK
jgi:hypothetical protein